MVSACAASKDMVAVERRVYLSNEKPRPRPQRQSKEANGGQTRKEGPGRRYSDLVIEARISSGPVSVRLYKEVFLAHLQYF